MRFKPDISRYTYPEKPDQHMLFVKHQVDTNFDENHRYYNNTFFYHVLRFFANILIHLFLYPFMYLRYGVKVEGRKNVRKAKKLKGSVMTICNHVFPMDYLVVTRAIRPKMEYFMAWPINFEGPNRYFIRIMGGVPIPQKLKAIKTFEKAIDDIVEDGRWLHVYPEGSMWYYYPYIRPLKKGCFKTAYKHNLPVLPMAISFRPRKGLFALYNKKEPLVTIKVGELMYLDNSLEKNDAIFDIQSRAYHEMQILAGITPDDPDYQTLERKGS